jgi:regulator of RNase E activity RraA
MGAKTALFRVFLNVPRPNPHWVEKFRGIPTGNICDAMDRFGALDYQIQALDRSVHLCGPAITVRTRPCDNLIIYKALEIAQPGDVLVITCHEYQTGSTVGDIVVKIAARKGIAGMVSDGLCRDASGIRATGLPVFVRGTSPSSPFKDGPGEINGPISCGGVPVHPGDLIVGDEDGVVVIPTREVERTAERLLAVQAKEAQMLRDVEAGVIIPPALVAELETRGIEVVE